MKRILLSWTLGAVALPLSWALWTNLPLLQFAWETRKNLQPATFTSVPFIDFNGKPLPQWMLWMLLALVGGFCSLTCYGLLRALSRLRPR